jgi:hypothetical protein
MGDRNRDPAADDNDGVRPQPAGGPSLFALKVTSFHVTNQGGWMEVAENFDYDKVIAELNRERMAENARHQATMGDLDRAIELMRSLKGRRTAESSNQMTLQVTANIDRTRYRGKTIIAAALDVLRSSGRALSTREVADALMSGGMETTSEKFTDLVYNSLYYAMKRQGMVTRDGDRWVLTAAGLASSSR